MSERKQNRLLKPEEQVGIVGYGAYIPRYRLPAREVARIWTGGEGGVPIVEKAVPGLDEDVITMSIEAARNAMARADIDPSEIRAVWVGSESHPYAVKPSSTVVAEAIGATPHTQAADWEFACKAGTEAMQAAIGLVGSGMARYTMAIGMDTAQGRPGDALEYTTGAGGAALILGPAEESVARFQGSYSYATDTPDFWRRANETYPEHGERFTGEPAYFDHVLTAAEEIMNLTDTRPEDFAHVVFHQPNAKFPMRAGRILGFKDEQIETGMLVSLIGNTYAGSPMIGLSAVLDKGQPGELVLLISYGSGAGSDAFVLHLTDRLPAFRDRAPKTQDYIDRRTEIDYATYARYRGKLALQ
ncbi:MAG: hydroxymethylglutaryl-CoA synthase [Anaerolineales bacterium]|jgi:hydroxymethylglutaryl-CoA synthase